MCLLVVNFVVFFFYWLVSPVSGSASFEQCNGKGQKSQQAEKSSSERREERGAQAQKASYHRSPARGHHHHHHHGTAKGEEEEERKKKNSAAATSRRLRRRRREKPSGVPGNPSPIPHPAARPHGASASAPVVDRSGGPAPSPTRGIQRWRGYGARAPDEVSVARSELSSPSRACFAAGFS